MNETGPVTNSQHGVSRPVFISYATADRKEALSVCNAIERRGTQCWISTRDVAPGENYQEEIVRAIRSARAMVLVFSEAANNSDEIKKELSLGSRHHIPVMALRIEDVDPSDAFAYELSTRQWIDAFDGWDRSLDALVRKLEEISAVDASSPVPRAPGARGTVSAVRMKTLIIVASGVLIVIASLAAWALMRPTGAAAHPMQVRLISFDRLATDLPADLPDAIHSEILSAFAEDGQVSVSTATAPRPGTAPAYALGGSIRRDSNNNVEVTARLTDERTGTLIWSHTYLYPTNALDRNLEKLPRWSAIDANGVIKCGLFNASTYPKRLSEQALRILFEVCAQQSDTPDPIGHMDLPARKLVQLVPDFSAAWSNFAAAALSNAKFAPFFHGDERALINLATAAAAKAVQLDQKNAQAYLVQSDILAPGDLVGREALLKKAIGARPLACGCEHAYYGQFLLEVGRVHEALAELRRALDIAPLQSDAEAEYAMALLMLGRKDEAERHFHAADNMVPVLIDRRLAIAWINGDYAAAVKAVKSGDFILRPAVRNSMLAAYEAISAGNSTAKAKAAADLAALSKENRVMMAAPLGALGANRLALDQFAYLDGSGDTARSAPIYKLLWYPSMAGVIRDRSFPAVAQRLGLMKYWKTTHTKPDACSAKNPPPFCGMI